MPFKTRYGSHYHMEEGCHGATIPCGTNGLEPCSDCCGGEADGCEAGGGASAVWWSEGEPQPEGVASVDGQAASPSADIIDRVRSWEESAPALMAPRPAPEPPRKRIPAFRQAWEKIERACAEAARDSIARKRGTRPQSEEERFMSGCLMQAKVHGKSDMGFARRIAECSTVSVAWPAGAERLPHRPMGAELEVVDVSRNGTYPVRSASVVGYSLAEAPSDMRRRGLMGIACRTEVLCSQGRIGGTQYEGVSSFLWGYGNVRPRISLVPLSEGEWGHAVEICEAYARGGDDSTRDGDGVGARDGEMEVVGRRTSESAGCRRIREMFGNGGDTRMFEADSFVLTPDEWDGAKRVLSGRRP